MTALYVVGASLGYFGNRQWAFRHSGSVRRSSLLYLFFHAGGYLLNYLMLRIFADDLGFPHQIVQAIAVILVAAYLFFAFNSFVFKTRNSEGSTR